MYTAITVRNARGVEVDYAEFYNPVNANSYMAYWTAKGYTVEVR